MCDNMKLIEILSPDFTFSDDRGTLTQIVHGGFSQVNAVFTKAGKIRGNFHYHEHTKELFFVIKGKIQFTAEYEGRKEEYIFSDGDMFLVNENVRHHFLYLEDTYLVGLYTEPVERADGTKDIVPA